MNQPSDIHFFVPGIPRPGGSKNAFAFRRKDGSLGARVTDAGKHTKKWRECIAAAARRAYDGPPLTGPLAIVMIAYMPRPKGHYGTGRNANKLKATAPAFHLIKPDATKLLRAAEDAMTGIIWKDDSQVVRQEVEKLYANAAAQIGLHVLVMSAEKGQ